MSMRALPTALLAAAGIAWCLYAGRPVFEVISVKPSAMQGGQYGIGLATFPGGRIRATMVTLDYFIGIAFHIQTFKVSGGPQWIHDERWDIEAKPEGSKASMSQHPGWHPMEIAKPGTTWLNKNNKVVDHGFFKVGDGTGFNSIYNYLEVIELPNDAAVDENLFNLERGGWAVSVVRRYFEVQRKK
jgi:hypothetical protein